MSNTGRSDLVDIDGELVPPYKTEMAYHFSNGDIKVWLPKSQCEWDTETNTMTIPYWLAEEKELI